MTAPCPRVVVTVGTDVHPFARLVSWVDGWAAAHGAGPEVLVQHGTSVPPRVARGVDYLDHDELVALMTRAAVVVTHGGPATIMEAREHHGRPIVVARDPAFGEHVDGHQIEFCRIMAREGTIDLVNDADRLARTIDQHLAAPTGPTAPGRGGVPAGVLRFAELVDVLLAGERTGTEP